MNDFKLFRAALITLTLVFVQGCEKQVPASQSTHPSSPEGAADVRKAASTPELSVDESDFKCLEEMTAVRHFYVDNLLGELDSTVAVAKSTEGGIYPPGSIVQLVPTEAMVKHRPGWNAATREVIAGIQEQDPRCTG